MSDIGLVATLDSLLGRVTDSGKVGVGAALFTLAVTRSGGDVPVGRSVSDDIGLMFDSLVMGPIDGGVDPDWSVLSGVGVRDALLRRLMVSGAIYHPEVQHRVWEVAEMVDDSAPLWTLLAVVSWAQLDMDTVEIGLTCARSADPVYRLSGLVRCGADSGLGFDDSLGVILSDLSESDCLSVSS